MVGEGGCRRLSAGCTYQGLGIEEVRNRRPADVDAFGAQVRALERDVRRDVVARCRVEDVLERRGKCVSCDRPCTRVTPEYAERGSPFSLRKESVESREPEGAQGSPRPRH